MYQLTHSRRGKTRYAAGFAADLAEGQTIADPVMTLERYEAAGWVDRTDEILDADSLDVDGTDVVFTLVPAPAADQQLPGVWRAHIQVTRSDGEVLPSPADFYIHVED